MNNTNIYRSTDEWKNALITLPDQAFFELINGIFGKIVSPYNKQRLIGDLAAYLSRTDIAETIAAYVDGRDASVLAAVAILEWPTGEELAAFLAGEIGFGELQETLINLEERFILYRFKDEGKSRLALNPVLQPVLDPFAADKDRLFPVYPADAAAVTAASRNSLAGSRLLPAFTVFVREEQPFYRAEGGLRKRTADRFAALFPGLDAGALVEMLTGLELFRREGDRLIADNDRLASFARLEDEERRLYLAAAQAVGPSAEQPFFNRGRVRQLARETGGFISALGPGRACPRRTLERRWRLIEKARPPAFPVETPPVDFDRLLEGLLSSGLLAKDSGRPECYIIGSLQPEPAADKGEAPAAPAAAIAFDSSFSFLLYPQIGFADALALSAFCTVTEYGQTVRFEISRDSALHGFNSGLKAADMEALLEKCSAGRLPENLGWTLRDWETRYGEVALYGGPVLCLSEERRYLASARPLSPLVAKELAPGVYLLKSAAPPEAAAAETVTAALAKAGVDMVAIPVRKETSARDAFSHIGRVAKPAAAEAEKPPAAVNDEERAAAGEKLKERFRTAAEKFAPDKKKILLDRIERRLILEEKQLDADLFREERSEARGLDYVGKANIAKQALSSGCFLDINWPEGRFIGMPQGMEKSGGESVLVVKPAGSDGRAGSSLDAAIRIPLGKIISIRRIKKSVFT